MSFGFVILICFLYLLFLFLATYYSNTNEKLKSIFNGNSFVYAFSLCVYCTAWTFYGSIGKASSSGLGYLGVYLGPTLFIPIWFIIIKKIIYISRYLRITSIADFISSRYGKNTTLGILVSILCLLIVVPYISIQLKALQFSFNILDVGLEGLKNTQNVSHFYSDPALIFGLLCALLAIFFGTRNVDPSEKHPGLVNVIAIESVIKLLCFLFGGIIIIYYIFDGVSDIFQQYNSKHDFKFLFTIHQESTDGHSWFWIMFISAFSFLLLPRQFHMAVVENTSKTHLRKAVWVVPVYLFLISLFVIPIALAGDVLFGNEIEPDTFLLSIPLSENYYSIVIIIFIGGLAASSGMIISSLIAMSIMISNNIFLPLLLKIKNQRLNEVEIRLLQLRRILIISILIFAFAFLKLVASKYSLVSIGLISFAGIAQLIPAVILGLYWKYANSKGIISGLLAGSAIWFFTLPYANTIGLEENSARILSHGVFDLGILRPTALFGVEGFSPISHSCIWSLSINLFLAISVSLFTKKSALEIAQSDIFLNPQKYLSNDNMTDIVIKRKAVFSDLKSVLNTILGTTRVDKILNEYLQNNKMTHFSKFADSKLINFLESYLSGTIGSASARVIFENIVDNKPVKPDQMFKVLNQTSQMYDYTVALEKKSQELKEKTLMIEDANRKLLELDQIKNEFINNVTHELRTPLTSIRSLSNTLSKYELEAEEKEKILGIIKSESDRLSELVNQILDLRKLEVKQSLNLETFKIEPFLNEIIMGFRGFKENRSLILNGTDFIIRTDKRKLKQILINLLNNAIKFTNSNGKINIDFVSIGQNISITVKDNGVGISPKDITHIFDRFYQSNVSNKPKSIGSGLGLSICQSLATLLEGKIKVTSEINKGSYFTLIAKNFKE